jgi:hypothetical protein
MEKGGRMRGKWRETESERRSGERYEIGMSGSLPGGTPALHTCTINTTTLKVVHKRVREREKGREKERTKKKRDIEGEGWRQAKREGEKLIEIERERGHSEREMERDTEDYGRKESGRERQE